jgi:hypothetical protein
MIGRFPERLALPGLFLAATVACAGPDALPYAGPGPYAVLTEAVVELDVRKAGEPVMSLRVVYPDGEGPWPLIVFSHGTFSSNEMFAPIAEHWASWGYVVLLPNHLDANRGFALRSNDDAQRLVRSRVDDMIFVLDSVDEIQAAVPGIKDRLALPPYVAGGHSIGSYVAMLVSGTRTRNPETGRTTGLSDKRFGAVVLSSDPGNMALMPDDLWLGASVPALVASGSEDYGLMGDGRIKADYQNEVLANAAAPTGQRYRLIIEELDHYFGGLVHRKPKDAKPDPEGLKIFNAVSTAFMEAYIKHDQSARDSLTETNLPAITAGRAVIEVM